MSSAPWPISPFCADKVQVSCPVSISDYSVSLNSLTIFSIKSPGQVLADSDLASWWQVTNFQKCQLSMTARASPSWNTEDSRALALAASGAWAGRATAPGLQPMGLQQHEGISGKKENGPWSTHIQKWSSIDKLLPPECLAAYQWAHLKALPVMSIRNTK
jgi:hypothetical protein